MERPTFSVPKIFNQRSERTLSFFRRESNLVQIPFVVFDDGIEAEREVGNENVMLQEHAAGRRHENAVGPGFYEHLRIGVIQADDVAREGDGRVD